MSDANLPRIEVSVARATLTSLITQVNAERVPRVLTRYGTDVAVLLPPGEYALLKAPEVKRGPSVVELMARPMADDVDGVPI